MVSKLNKKEKIKTKDDDKKQEEIPASKQSDVETEEKKEPTIEEKLSDAEKEILELKNKLLRKAAEFENFRRRSNQEKASWIKNATQRLVLQLCDVVDNFERAIQTGEKDHQFDSFLKGVEMIYSQLENILKKEGVKKMDSLGKEFDPSFHEALTHIPSEYEENFIAAVIQNGYSMNDKIIRPAKVAVSNGVKLEQTEKLKKQKKGEL